MPFRARTEEGKIVVPAMIEKGEVVRCLRCAGRMFVRDPQNSTRHFFHSDDNVGELCPSSRLGESSEHAGCVELAVEALQDTFAEEPGVDCAAEVQIDVTGGLSTHEYRRGDAVATFPEEHPEFGQGVVIEVQHKHDEKHLELTTHDYLTAGYSVLWLGSSEFTDTRLTDTIQGRFERGLKSAYAACDGLRKVWECETFQYTNDHAFKEVPAAYLDGEEPYEICTSRPCALRRRWDPDIDEYRYAPDDLPNVTVLFAALEDAVRINPNHSRKEWSRDEFSMRYGDAITEKILANGETVAPCRGPGGIHQWEFRESLWEGYAHVGLHDCRHCRAVLYADRRGYADEHTSIIFDREPDSAWQLPSLTSNPRECTHPAHDKKAAAEGCPDCGLLI